MPLALRPLIPLLAVPASLLSAAPAAARDVAELFDPASVAAALCGRAASGPAPEWQQIADLPATPAATKPTLWAGLGDWTFRISSTDAAAQAYFDQGLRLAYGFNHGEAVRAFRAAQAADPACAICVWGEALALGPNINERMSDDAGRQALAAVKRAQKLAPRANDRERALIAALGTRYSDKPKATRAALDAAYAAAMAKVYARYPNDPDIGTLFAEAALDSAPREWWAKDGVTPLGRSGEALAVLEHVLAATPDHPGAIHFYIHVTEPTRHPEKAEPYADKLGALMPAAGHMVHMPSHTFFRIGRYADALRVNLAAVSADESLFKQVSDPTPRYRYGYYPHNINMAMASADMAGDAANALAMADKLGAAMAGSESILNDYYAAAAFNARLRFASPQALLALPRPPDSRRLAVGFWLYAQGSARAWQGDAAAAQTIANDLAAWRDGTAEPKDQSRLRQNKVLTVAEDMLRARIAIAGGNTAEARRHLDAAIAIGDAEDFWRGDPPPWDFPVRQALGVLLLKTGQAEAAIPILRAALIDTPNNGWVLFALQQAAALTGDTLAATEYGKLFAKAWVGTQPPNLERI